MKQNVGDLRKRLEATRASLARAEGEHGSLQQEIDGHLEKLQKLLGCKSGQEREAIQKLRGKLSSDEAEVLRLIEEAEKVRDAPVEQES